MSNTRRRATVGAAAVTSTIAALALGVASGGPAGATPPAPSTLKVTKVISSAYVGPLQFAVAGKRIYVADSFTANLYRVGRAAPLVHSPDPAGSGEATPDIAGVGVDSRTGVVAFTETNADHSFTRLSLLLPSGKTKVLANLSAYEAAHNPDGRTHYGIDHPSACVQAAFAKLGAPASYTGMVDSHPYAVVALGHGAWAVADAGGNDIVRVDRYGHVSTIAVLPPAPVKITAGLAKANGLAACTVGLTYKFEAVPTDVELGPLGTLLTTTLASGPGGDPTPVATGSVYAIGYGGRLVRLATGFNNATNLAYDGRGHIFVAELGSGQITELSLHGRSVVATLPGVVGVEFANGHLYASTAPAAAGGSGPGTIVELGR